MLPQEHVASYHAEGYISVPGVLSAGEIAELRQVTDEFVEKSRQATDHTDVFDLEPGHTPQAPRLRRLKFPGNWHRGGVNRADAPRWCVLGYFQRSWIKGITDSKRLLPPEAIQQMSEDAKRLLGILPAPSDYSEVKALTPDQIGALTLEQKKVLGFPVY